MKYLHQAVLLASITFAAELVKYVVPLPVPARKDALLLLDCLLKSGIVKLEQGEDVGGLLLELMPVLLVPASVSFLTVMDTIQAMLLPVLLMGFMGTLVVMFVTGRVSQWMIRRKGGRRA